MEKLTIYHIPGVKVGCTNDFEHRKIEYPPCTCFEIIETFDCDNLEIGTEREFYWADYFGYNRGTPYHVARSSRKKMSKVGGAKSFASSNHNSKNGKLTAASIASPNHNSKHPNHLSKRLFVCPHCSKIGKGVGMLTFHFDNCKFQKIATG